MDQELEACRRTVAHAPEAPAAWLGLAASLNRAGERDEALEALYRAGALGAAAERVREVARGMGVRPSPWPEIDADCQGSRRSPLRGPRRGEVVARTPGTPAFAVLDADGTLLHPHEGITLHAARTLAPLESIPDVHSPTVTSRCTLVHGKLADRTTTLRPLRGAGPTWTGAKGRGDYVRPTEDPAGRVHVHGWVLSPELAPLHAHPPGCEATSLSVTPDLRLAVVERAPGLWKSRLRLFDPEARPVAAFDLVQGHRPVCGDDGRVLTVLGEALTALGPDGAAAWAVPVRRGGLGFHLALAEGGACYFAWGQDLLRVEAGRVAWRSAAERVVSHLVVDREGVLYAGTVRDPDGARRLIARGPDGRLLFELPGRAVPLLIDGFGRLLARLDQELVAIE